MTCRTNKVQKEKHKCTLKIYLNFCFYNQELHELHTTYMTFHIIWIASCAAAPHSKLLDRGVITASYGNNISKSVLVRVAGYTQCTGSWPANHRVRKAQQHQLFFSSGCCSFFVFFLGVYGECIHKIPSFFWGFMMSAFIKFLHLGYFMVVTNSVLISHVF